MTRMTSGQGEPWPHPEKATDTMASSLGIKHPHKRPRRRPVERAPRPVLQLPLERPEYRDKPAPEDEGVEPVDPVRERGVAIIDFYI